MPNVRDIRNELIMGINFAAFGDIVPNEFPKAAQDPQVEKDNKFNKEVYNYIRKSFLTLNSKLTDFQYYRMNIVQNKKFLYVNGYYLSFVKNAKLISLYLDHDLKKINQISNTHQINFNNNNKFFKVVLNNYKNSSSIFGYTNIKKKLFLNKEDLEIINIIKDYKCKKDNVLRDIAEIYVKSINKKLKFILSDVSIINNEININKYINGYNEPKIKILSPGTQVLINNKTFKNKLLTYKTRTSIGNNVFLVFEDEDSKKRYILNKQNTKYKIK